MRIGDLAKQAGVNIQTVRFYEREQVLRQPFDLENGPLVRLHLLTRSENDRVMLLAFHHLACDGASLRLLLEEFGKKSGFKLPPEVEERARKEKAEALTKLYEARFSVLHRA